MNKEEEKKKEKKAAGAPWGFGGAREAAQFGARSGAQVLSRAPAILLRGAAGRGFMASVAHFFSTGTGMLALTAMVAGVSFFSLWDLNRQRQDALAKQRAASAFNDAAGGMRGGAQGDARAAGDSLSFLSAANKGALGDGSATAPAAEAQAAAAPDAGAKKAGEKGDGKDKDKDKEKADADAAAQAAAAAMANRYGRLSSGLGGGGLAGGGLAGGSGMFGGVGRAFDKGALAQLPSAMRNGGLSAMQSGPAASSASVKRSPIQPGAKGAMGQLRFGAGTSQAATAKPSGEGKAYTAGQAFEGNTGLAGGAGPSVGGTGLTSGPSGAQTGGSGLDPGGPIAGGPAPNPVTPSVPNPGYGRDVTPWASQVQMAQLLMALAGILLLVAHILGQTPWHWAAEMVAKMAAVVAAVVTVLGVMIMAQGQMIQGLIFTGSGALLTYLAWTYHAPEAAHAEQVAAGEAANTGAPAEAEATRVHLDPEFVKQMDARYPEIAPPAATSPTGTGGFVDEGDLVKFGTGTPAQSDIPAPGPAPSLDAGLGPSQGSPKA